MGDRLVLIPDGHSCYIFPITPAEVRQSIDEGDLTPVAYDGHGSPLYEHQLEPEDG